jgi:NAD(P)-dependent dehydrogenase (short-subunit alcohol dehydrogenase family)
MISLAGKAALITGGSRGIGAATVKLFAEAGADVVFSYHANREAAAAVEQEARKHGTRIESCRADPGKMPGAKKLVEFTREGSDASISWLPMRASGMRKMRRSRN